MYHREQGSLFKLTILPFSRSLLWLMLGAWEVTPHPTHSFLWIRELLLSLVACKCSDFLSPELGLRRRGVPCAAVQSRLGPQ